MLPRALEAGSQEVAAHALQVPPASPSSPSDPDSTELKTCRGVSETVRKLFITRSRWTGRPLGRSGQFFCSKR